MNMLILNEEKYAMNLLLGKHQDVKSAIKKIGYITRYNAQILGKDDNWNYNSTVAWMTKHQINFDEASYSNVISNAIKGAKKRALYESDDIVITRNELKKIESLNNIRAEKMTFVLLCMAKQQAKINDFYGTSSNFTDGLVRYTVTELCKMARVSVPAEDREYILHYILVQGLISCPKRNDTKCLWVNFIDKDGEEALRLNEIDCQELAYVYLNWKGKEEFKRCTRCGKLMKRKASDNICTDCSLASSPPLQIWCIDCGDEVEVPLKDTHTCRCPACNKQHQRDRNVKKNMHYRARIREKS
nr:MAG TPA: DNA-directed RNA polymerase [Caudoviricetes sp.]